MTIPDIASDFGHIAIKSEVEGANPCRDCACREDARNRDDLEKADRTAAAPLISPWEPRPH